MAQIDNPDEPVRPTTIKDLLYQSKLRIYEFLSNTEFRFYTFLTTTIFNLYTIEGAVLSALVTLYPSHAQEIVYYFATYLGFKPTKQS